jgi:hypothetical protein
MTADDHEEALDGGEWAADEEHDVRGRTETLVSQIARLYNENTLLRERVRALEREIRKAPKRG